MLINVLIITPLFFGDSSGASVYYRLLSSCLLDDGHTVTVISDREKGKFQGQYYGLFPGRCGRERKFPRDFITYVIQNLKYFLITGIIHREQPDTLLVHSSFYNHPGIFVYVINHIRRRFPQLNMVLDVRDRLIPQWQIKKLSIYNRIIACSENVVADLKSKGISEHRITYIPVLQEKLSVDLSSIPTLLEKLEISQPYIYYAGLVKESKGIDLLLDAFLNHIRNQESGLSLVISGLLKTTSTRMVEMLGMEGVFYVGNRSRDEVLQLMAGASVCVNLSPNEGMPRSCLESLALDRPVILPPNIPEFQHYCADAVISSRESKEIARRVLTVIKEKKVPAYPIKTHYPEYVLPKYLEIL